jgi:hypothetical protein
MENFTEAHSVSGIIGVPPGYVGHEDGGRLINELNADPFSRDSKALRRGARRRSPKPPRSSPKTASRG